MAGPAHGTQIIFNDGTQNVFVDAAEGKVEAKGGWVVVTFSDGQVDGYPARRIHEFNTKP